MGAFPQDLPSSVFAHFNDEGGETLDGSMASRLPGYHSGRSWFLMTGGEFWSQVLIFFFFYSKGI